MAEQLKLPAQFSDAENNPDAAVPDPKPEEEVV